MFRWRLGASASPLDLHAPNHFDTCWLILKCKNVYHSEPQPEETARRYIQGTDNIILLICVMVVLNIKSSSLLCQKRWRSTGIKFSWTHCCAYFTALTGCHDRGWHCRWHRRCPEMWNESTAGAHRQVQVSARGRVICLLFSTASWWGLILFCCPKQKGLFFPNTQTVS